MPTWYPWYPWWQSPARLIMLRLTTPAPFCGRWHLPRGAAILHHVLPHRSKPSKRRHDGEHVLNQATWAAALSEVSKDCALTVTTAPAFVPDRPHLTHNSASPCISDVACLSHLAVAHVSLSLPVQLTSNKQAGQACQTLPASSSSCPYAPSPRDLRPNTPCSSSTHAPVYGQQPHSARRSPTVLSQPLGEEFQEQQSSQTSSRQPPPPPPPPVSHSTSRSASGSQAGTVLGHVPNADPAFRLISIPVQHIIAVSRSFSSRTAAGGFVHPIVAPFFFLNPTACATPSHDDDPPNSLTNCEPGWEAGCCVCAARSTPSCGCLVTGITMQGVASVWVLSNHSKPFASGLSLRTCLVAEMPLVTSPVGRKFDTQVEIKDWSQNGRGCLLSCLRAHLVQSTHLSTAACCGPNTSM